MKEQIIQQLIIVIRELGLENIIPQVVTPTDLSRGDYASNVALIVSGKLGQNPRNVAQEIVDKLQMDKYFKKIEVAGPGFINFWLKNEVLQASLDESNRNTSVGALNDKKIMVEFTDSNPFKEFHIGHLYSNLVGESISRLLESQGAQVKRACYQGDVGLHVAKSLFGMQELMQEQGLTLLDIDQKPLEERVAFMGKAYALGARAYEESNTDQVKIQEINTQVFNHAPQVEELYQKGKMWSLEYFETIYKRLGTKFDNYFFESESGVVGEQIVREGLQKGIFTESDGAIIFKGEAYGLHTRVFINSRGLPTYEAKELGLSPTKYKKYPYDLSLIITGNEINDYFSVMLKALSLIYPDLAAKTKHISHGMVRLPSGKMSSRTGNILLGMWLLDEVKKSLALKYPEMEPNVLEIVAQGAVKYALLKNSLGGDIAFDIDQSISFEGNSGPYLQYCVVRARSILAKVLNDEITLPKSTVVLEKEEEALLRILFKFKEVVNDAATYYAPHILATYLFELAHSFSSFYEKQQVVNAQKIEQKQYRLVLVKAIGNTIEQGLGLLGIQTPKKM